MICHFYVSNREEWCFLRSCSEKPFPFPVRDLRSCKGVWCCLSLIRQTSPPMCALGNREAKIKCLAFISNSNSYWLKWEYYCASKTRSERFLFFFSPKIAQNWNLLFFKYKSCAFTDVCSFDQQQQTFHGCSGAKALNVKALWSGWVSLTVFLPEVSWRFS